MKRAVLLVLSSLGWLVGGPGVPAAEGHARVTGTYPVENAVLDTPPGFVAVEFAAKALTVEGDPLAVYAADGRRVDDGAIRIDDGATVLAVGLTSGPLPAGRYDVVYRVISDDTHLVAGGFSFESRRAAGEETLRLLPASGISHEPAGTCSHCGTWAVAVAGVAVLVVALAGLGMPRARPAPSAEGVPRWWR